MAINVGWYHIDTVILKRYRITIGQEVHTGRSTSGYSSTVVVCCINEYVVAIAVAGCIYTSITPLYFS
jgi:hypothetical protein